MADTANNVQDSVQTNHGGAPKVHPVAPRLKNGPKVPHIGPHFHAYKKAHEETVGHESDKWWSKVRRVVHRVEHSTRAHFISSVADGP